MESVLVSDMASTTTTATTSTQTATTTTQTFMVKTRFPPEPNGYLHLGHAKAISFNFAVAHSFGGVCHMRLDDTNPTTEDAEYVNAILEDVIWIQEGLFDPITDIVPWHGPVRKTSDYFETIYNCAETLIQSGQAYVDSLTLEEMRLYRGTLTQPGRESPYRSSRTISDNLDLFRNMRMGLYPEGTHVLRAKINMSSPNLNLRDPVLYRIKTGETAIHPATGTTWCIYPMYDFSHPIADAMEGITHSLCTLEFADHRPLYEWTLTTLRDAGVVLCESDSEHDPDVPPPPSPQQIEFSRLNIQNTILSKRKLIQLVQARPNNTNNNNTLVSGWDDPRMPTLSGLRRRGFSPAAIRLFCERVGISKTTDATSSIAYTVLEDCAREVLDGDCPRAMAVLQPLKITILNYKEDHNEDMNANDTEDDGEDDTRQQQTRKMEYFHVDRHPKQHDMGQRTIPFANTLYIERSDFLIPTDQKEKPIMVVSPLDSNDCSPNTLDQQDDDGGNGGGRVRLRNAYVIECRNVIRDPVTREPIALECVYFPTTRSGVTPEGMERVQGIIHWVEASTAVTCTVHQYDRLFLTAEPGKDKDGDFLQEINPHSLEVLHSVVVEPSVADDAVETMKKVAHQQQETMRNNEETKDETIIPQFRSRLYPSSLTYQFERNGYFALDPSSTSRKHLVFNRVVTLRDTWGAVQDRSSSSSSSSTKPRTVPRIRGVTTAAVEQNNGSSCSSSSMSSNDNNNNNELVADIRRIAIRVATIVSIQPHPQAENLWVCQVDCGDMSEQEPAATAELRTVVAALGGNVDDDAMDQKLVGQKVLAVTNLKPAKMRGIESTAMLLAASNGKEEDGEDDLKVELLYVSETVPNGELIFLEGMEPSIPDAMLKSKGALKAWERAKAGLKINKDGEATYVDENGIEYRLISSAGPIQALTLTNAIIQ